MEEHSSDTDASGYEQPSVSKRGTEGKTRSSFSRGRRRPDKAIYVPRALRQPEYDTILGSSSCSPSLSVSEESSSDTTDPPPANHEPGTDSADESVGEPDATASTAQVETGDYGQTLSYFMAMTLEEKSEDTSQTNTSCQDTEEMDNYHHEVPGNIHDGTLYGHEWKKSPSVLSLQVSVRH